MRGVGMADTNWVEITTVVPEPMAETFADFLLELTGNGVSIENRKVDTFNIEDLLAEPVKNVKCYMPENGEIKSALAKIEEYLLAEEVAFPGFTFFPPTFSILKEEDWANSWKVNFKPTRIGERLIIKPSWEAFASGEGDILLELDPGMAFGTGTHATTRLCLELLERLVYRENAFKENRTVLDVGCGSGVLGIAAALFGAEKVDAIDIDPIAVAVTSENAAINGVSATVSASETPLAEMSGRYAIVLANILAEALVKMSCVLTEKVAAGGFLILSGILAEREEFVIAGFAREALTLHSVTRQEEWCCIVFLKSVA
jgi:ribosomal protein L11 methyltransferase